MSTESEQINASTLTASLTKLLIGQQKTIPSFSHKNFYLPNHNLLQTKFSTLQDTFNDDSASRRTSILTAVNSRRTSNLVSSISDKSLDGKVNSTNVFDKWAAINPFKDDDVIDDNTSTDVGRNVMNDVTNDAQTEFNEIQTEDNSQITISNLQQPPQTTSWFINLMKKLFLFDTTTCKKCHFQKKSIITQNRYLQLQNQTLMEILQIHVDEIESLHQECAELAEEKSMLVGELESLSQALFEEANKMVSDQTRKTSELTLRNQELNSKLEKTLQDLSDVAATKSLLAKRRESVYSNGRKVSVLDTGEEIPGEGIPPHARKPPRCDNLTKSPPSSSSICKEYKFPLSSSSSANSLFPSLTNRTPSSSSLITRSFHPGSYKSSSSFIEPTSPTDDGKSTSSPSSGANESKSNKSEKGTFMLLPAPPTWNRRTQSKSKKRIASPKINLTNVEWVGRSNM